jgi:UDP-N-acetylglucosamine 2-epimerase
MKVMTIAGTRPELIRLSRVINRLDSAVEHVLVHTGQNYDYELNEVFFKDLGIRRPDYFLDTDRSSLGKMIGTLLIRVEDVLREEQPDAVLILGDTNSAMACILARRMRIPVYHMEAGNRSFDLNIPEEMNRRLVDHVSDINLVYTEHARRNLIAEGLSPRQIYLTGSPMAEVLQHYASHIKESGILDEQGLTSGEYLLVSLHREENVDNRASLQTILHTLEVLGKKFDRPVLVSTHPRTRNRLEKVAPDRMPDGVIFHAPFGFMDYVKLQQNAFCVVSDSGTISEEAAILGFPAVTIRNSMERPEAMDHGNIVLCGLKAPVVESAIRLATSIDGSREIPAEYRVTNCSERVLRILVGTAGLVHGWNGVQRQDLQDAGSDRN